MHSSCWVSDGLHGNYNIGQPNFKTEDNIGSFQGLRLGLRIRSDHAALRDLFLHLELLRQWRPSRPGYHR